MEIVELKNNDNQNSKIHWVDPTGKWKTGKNSWSWKQDNRNYSVWATEKIRLEKLGEPSRPVGL